RGAAVLSLMKGVELGTSLRMSQLLIDVAGIDACRVAALSGPNLAKEIAQGQPAATVVACTDAGAAERLQTACTTAYFRPYTNVDVVGCELGGAVKNVIALATGMAEGMGFGDNTKASLITRGLAETARLGAALGADPMTFSGLAGLGDLVATCTSPLSRNRTFGERLGRGESLAQAEEANHGQVAEGVKSCTSICELGSRHGVELPIADAVRRVCHEGLSPAEMGKELISRAPRHERR
ncbi:MAG: glycerol-3-phosphate dehydrogenase, partial [Pseudonocardiales bacterium]|nr:glycerol-3-phosphate dehydrogenase [Pseudonocardiales bacterium]